MGSCFSTTAVSRQPPYSEPNYVQSYAEPQKQVYVEHPALYQQAVYPQVVYSQQAVYPQQAVYQQQAVYPQQPVMYTHPSLYQQPVYTQQPALNTGTAIVGGMLAGMVLEDMFDD
jgi:hypothetical protein